ncbi:MAG: glycosyltransferase [Bacteroidales bacterium]
MKVLILSDANSSHTKKWVNSLVKEGINICLFSLTKCNEQLYENIQIVNICLNKIDISTNKNDTSKFKYLKTIPILKKAIKNFKPDILHAHYASSYGLLGALSDFHPLIISVWGADVYKFPTKSFFHKLILKFNLSRADKILSTSHVMAVETSKYTKKSIQVTPFGVDLEKFKLLKKNNYIQNKLVIGTVKTLDPKYGIELLIRAFSMVQIDQDLSLELIIVGGGPQYSFLRKIVKDLGLINFVQFVGQISPEEVPFYLNKFDIYIALSTENSESFGVAVIEASACEIPVVVSNVGGLPEVVEDGITGFIVPNNNPEAAAAAILKLILNSQLRHQMGKAGRERVKRLYNWNDNIDLMLSIYNDVLENRMNNNRKVYRFK